MIVLKGFLINVFGLGYGTLKPSGALRGMAGALAGEWKKAGPEPNREVCLRSKLRKDDGVGACPPQAESMCYMR